MRYKNKSIVYTSVITAIIIFLFAAANINSHAKEKGDVSKAVFYVA